MLQATPSGLSVMWRQICNMQFPEFALFDALLSSFYYAKVEKVVKMRFLLTCMHTSRRVTIRV